MKEVLAQTRLDSFCLAQSDCLTGRWGKISEVAQNWDTVLVRCSTLQIVATEKFSAK